MSPIPTLHRPPTEANELDLKFKPWAYDRVNPEIDRMMAEGRRRGKAWARFVAMCGGRRIWKTDWLLKRLLKRLLANPQGSDAGYVNRTVKQASITAWKRAKALFSYPNDWLLEGKPNENAKSIQIVGNRTLWLIGCDDPEAQRGFGFCHLGFDEATINSNLPEMWPVVFQPMLADKLGTADFTYTQRGKGWMYQQWLKGRQDATSNVRDAAWVSFLVTTAEAGTVPGDELVRQRKDMGDDWYEQEYECRALEYVGLAAHEFVHAAVRDGGNILERARFAKLRDRLTWYGVIDYARSSGTTVRLLFGVDPLGRIGFVDEMSLPGGMPARLAGKIRERDRELKVSPILHIAGRDCWGKESDGTSMAERVSHLGIPCQPCPARLEDAVLRLNELCSTSEPAEEGEPDLPFFWVLEGECPHLVRQLCTLDSEDLEKKTQHLKDAFDCARMAVASHPRALLTRRPAIAIPRAGIVAKILAQAGSAPSRGVHPISGRPL